jgi:hypothetical protein
MMIFKRRERAPPRLSRIFVFQPLRSHTEGGSANADSNHSHRFLTALINLYIVVKKAISHSPGLRPESGSPH